MMESKQQFSDRYTIQELAKDMLAATRIDGECICEIAFTDDEGQKINIECAVTFVDGIPKAKQWSQIRWKPIDTAPKDGAAILVFGGGRIAVAMWCFDTEWASVEPCRGDPLNEPPTHWMPLPGAPNELGQGSAACGASPAPTGSASR